tara:strand:+ start:229 stop:501 length:273 start_codon:yes stop_codon:yes gene_type:complete
MALTKKTTTDKIETVKDQNFYILQVREVIEVYDDGNLISTSYHRYTLNPDHDIDSITDATVKAQFKAIMTAKVKKEYQTFQANRSNLTSS